MSNFLLLERIKVQNANAASGFTWGFPAITHFLGFAHKLGRELQHHADFREVVLNGCVVIAHEHNVHSYKFGGGSKDGEFKGDYLSQHGQVSGSTAFTQYKTAQYLPLKFPKGILGSPAINEEAKMNMTVSLLIPIDSYMAGVNKSDLVGFLQKCCLVSRLAGGTILEIKNVELIDLSDDGNQKSLRYRLLPGFVLQDRSDLLEKQFAKLKQSDDGIELLDAWFDFIALKQVARPICPLIDKHLAQQAKQSDVLFAINESWLEHKQEPFEVGLIPSVVISYFQENEDNFDKALLNQWNDYLHPTEKVDANWEYVKKPDRGFLVPIMAGYKAITELFPAGEIEGARDAETDVRFVESVHSIGEWQSVHRIRSLDGWRSCVWNYSYEEEGWYLCRQADGTLENGSN